MFIFIVFLLLEVTSGIYQECERIHSCSCLLRNGVIINFMPLVWGDPNQRACTNRPRFQYYNATNINDDHLYSYNPCYSFTDGDAGKSPLDSPSCSLGVAVCQISRDQTEFHSLGLQGDNTFHWNPFKGTIDVVYTDGLRKTNVTFECSNLTVLEVKGETAAGSGMYEMTLKTPYACLNMTTPDMTQDIVWASNGNVFSSNGTSGSSGGLSTGSILVIIFFVTTAVYFFGGMAYLKFVRGAVGKEMVPDYEFWMDFPLLVRDGAVFVFGGCQPATVYEQI